MLSCYLAALVYDASKFQTNDLKDASKMAQGTRVSFIKTSLVLDTFQDKENKLGIKLG